MTNFFSKKSNSRFTRLLEWGRLLLLTGSAQLLIQCLSFASGILVIRLLPIQEYAIYTLANTMLGTIALLADGGVATGAMSIGGKVWQDPSRLGRVMATAMQLRRKFVRYALLCVLPILYYLLNQHGASPLMIICVIVTLLPAIVASITGEILEVAPSLNQDVKALQKLQILNSGARLLFTSAFLFAFPFAALAILVPGICQYWKNLQLRRVAAKYADSDAEEDPEVRSEMISIVRRILPMSLYFSISSQLTIWLIGIFGDVESIAQIGALSRLAMVLTIITSIYGALIVPRFARLPDDRTLLTQRFILIQVGFTLIASVIMLLVYLFPEQLLYILGANYEDLTKEVVLICAGSLLAMISAALYSLNSSRAYVLHPGVHIPFNLLVLVLSIVIFPPTSTLNALYINLMRAVFGPLIQNLIFFRYSRLKLSHQ
jgi:O-antigen/teichoic acid export membrane protein